MGYSIGPGRGVCRRVRRVGKEQIERGIAALDEADENPHEAVHEARTRCKKVRALLRLVRGSIGDEFDALNAHFRDAARIVASVRDAQAMVEVFDGLAAHAEDRLSADEVSKIRSALIADRDEAEHAAGDIAGAIGEFRARLVEGKDRIGALRLTDEGFDALAGGLARTYARARKAMRLSRRRPDAATLHEWRKRTKYHRYHMRLLRPVWLPVVKARMAELHHLTDLLGEHHDLSVLAQIVSAEPARFGSDPAVAALRSMIDDRRAWCALQARPLGERLFAEKPGRFLKRFEAYWDAQKSSRRAAAGAG